MVTPPDLLSVVDKMAEALEFYADIRSYYENRPGEWEVWKITDKLFKPDTGKVANKALTLYNNWKKAQ